MRGCDRSGYASDKLVRISLRKLVVLRIVAQESQIARQIREERCKLQNGSV
jgi:hypothetical protein